ncbi:hypothetical protein HPP92_000930 [Vanilla planifolia]|uniref:PI-PLC X domain-containing protein At5g67130-like n=1 Tax=Vanilla planifolia TaxID=51239 RepID=A0A835VL35_VANPL|nr:hypothetical protein HPP92_000930 [Vanilla planifolia]
MPLAMNPEFTIDWCELKVELLQCSLKVVPLYLYPGIQWQPDKVDNHVIKSNSKVADQDIWKIWLPNDLALQEHIKLISIEIYGRVGTKTIENMVYLLPKGLHAKVTSSNARTYGQHLWSLSQHHIYINRKSPLDCGSLWHNPQMKLSTQNGVRGLMLDMYDFQNDIWLCHSVGGNCYNFTAFQPAINVLKEIQTFLETNPSEVITIFIEDYVTSHQGLTKVFNASGLSKYWFPASEMPKNGGDWPLLSTMISNNQRLLVFTSKKNKEATEGIAYEWNYVVENQYGDAGLKAGRCPNRAESSPMDTRSKSLILMNNFPDNPNSTAACLENSAPLVSMLYTCHNLSGNRWANFIAVDFYKESNGGGAAQATDIANGHLVCGCDNIAYCKANSTFGTCKQPSVSTTLEPSASNQSAPSSASLTRKFSSYLFFTIVTFVLYLCR